MSSTDRIAGRYTIETIAGSCGDGNIWLNPNEGKGTVQINGNLLVIGTASRIQTQETSFIDNFITLSSNVTTVPILDSGIEVNRGTKPKVSIRYKESLEMWQLTNDGITFANIYGKEPLLSRVSDDQAPQIGGNLNLKTFSIISDTNTNIVFRPGNSTNGATGTLQIQQVAPNSTIIYRANSAQLFANTAGTGGTGLYTIAPDNSHQELVSRKKAMILSIIF
jgi:hypothetical protein